MLQIAWLAGCGLIAIGAFTGAFAKGRSVVGRIVFFIVGVLFAAIGLTALNMGPH